MVPRVLELRGLRGVVIACHDHATQNDHDDTFIYCHDQFMLDGRVMNLPHSTSVGLDLHEAVVQLKWVSKIGWRVASQPCK